MSTNCPVCLDPGPPIEFFEASDVPVHCHILSSTRDAACAVPRGDIRLGLCRVCGLIYNMAFEASLTGYQGNYDNSLHFSERFQQYARDLAKSLVRRYHLKDKLVVEIGSGRGDFLALLRGEGMSEAVGFDPSFQSDPDSAAEGIRLIRDFYPSDKWRGTADLICCRHTLEHVTEPRRMLEAIRGDAAAHNSVLYFEVPHVMHSLRDQGVWDVIYEHCLYFSEPALLRLFHETGYSASNVRVSFGGQFLSIEATASNGAGPYRPKGQEEELAELESLAASFSRSYSDTVSTWAGRLRTWTDERRKIVVWGAGSKGVSFLNAVPGTDRIEHVIDINPRKEGKYIAGSGQRIVGPQWLAGHRSRYAVLVMNQLYELEIRRALADLELDCDVVVVDVPTGTSEVVNR